MAPQYMEASTIHRHMLACLDPSGQRVSIPGFQVPDANITIATTTDHGILPWHHGPDAHDMSLQCALGVSISIKYMDPSIIQSHNDIFWSQMQARNDATFLSDVSVNTGAARSPRSLN